MTLYLADDNDASCTDAVGSDGGKEPNDVSTSHAATGPSDVSTLKHGGKGPADVSANDGRKGSRTVDPDYTNVKEQGYTDFKENILTPEFSWDNKANTGEKFTVRVVWWG